MSESAGGRVFSELILFDIRSRHDPVTVNLGISESLNSRTNCLRASPENQICVLEQLVEETAERRRGAAAADRRAAAAIAEGAGTSWVAARTARPDHQVERCDRAPVLCDLSAHGRGSSTKALSDRPGGRAGRDASGDLLALRSRSSLKRLAYVAPEQCRPSESTASGSTHGRSLALVRSL
jgi:hypothetical protein